MDPEELKEAWQAFEEAYYGDYRKCDKVEIKDGIAYLYSGQGLVVVMSEECYRKLEGWAKK